ncbi:MAG: bifunctional oligoribonuclease/PAP phosphatase NrnA [Bacilli bacterium]|nr:bifunctional oligoribonuclease/PAP phosphatase NrnA [Bacilli bacterium]
MYKKIYRQIKKYNDIVIARHIGPDPDCIASQIALRDIIKNTFPNKKVYAVGVGASKFYHFGRLNKISDDIPEKALLIVVDTPDKGRVDGVDVEKFAYRIKIDHHPFIEKFCDLEFIDDTASSACQVILEFCFKTPLKITKEAAEILFMGLVSDTNRFMYYYTTNKTFNIVGKLMEKFNLDLDSLYHRLYERPLSEVRLQGYIGMNMIVTENKLGYIKLTNDIIKEFGVDSASAGNMINNFNNIKEVIAWVTFSEDIRQKLIRVAIRSRGPIINELAKEYGGGGHAFASGIKLKTWDEVDAFIVDLDKHCKEYLETTNAK